VAQGVALQGGGRPQQRSAPSEAGLAELIGNRRVDVDDERQAEDPGNRRREVGRLLDGVHHVEPAGQHAPGSLRHERHIQEQLRQRRAGPDAPDGKAEAAPVPEAGNAHRRSLREREQLHVVAVRDQRADHGEHGQRRAPHLEERLGSEKEDAQARRPRSGRGPRAHAGDAASDESGSQSSVMCSPRKRSASMAAMQPVPAAVTAWRYRESWTSPAAKTPRTLVAVL
jgi:hypothetical protein